MASIEGTLAAVEGTSPQSTPASLAQMLLAGSSAELVCLVREGEVLARASRAHDGEIVTPGDLVAFPEAPAAPLLVDFDDADNEWGQWCTEVGLRSCAVTPVAAAEGRLGVFLMASREPDRLDAGDLSRLEMAAWLASRGWESDESMDALRRQFADVYLVVTRALPLRHAITARPGFRQLARAIGTSLDATYCRIALVAANGQVVIEASAGHRIPHETTGRAPLGELPACEEALRDGRPISLSFDEPDSGEHRERQHLFTPTTRSGLILPFPAGPGLQGMLLVGEERLTRSPARSRDRAATLQLVADRLGEILAVANLLEHQRAADRRLQTRAAELKERRRLARELHDVVGQSLSAVLIQLRAGIDSGGISLRDLRQLETAAQRALTVAGEVAYDLRHLEDPYDHIEGARSYAESTLAAAGYRLDWIDRRIDRSLSQETAREIAMVIREAVTNVVRHARGNRVEVRLVPRRERIRVTVQDNGVGFSPGQLALRRDGRGLGLLGSAERLKELGGVFEVTALASGGTLVTAEAPWVPGGALVLQQERSAVNA